MTAAAVAASITSPARGTIITARFTAPLALAVVKYWVAPATGNHTLAPNQPYVVYVDEEGTVLVPGYESAYPRETFPSMVWQPVQPHTYLK